MKQLIAGGIIAIIIFIAFKIQPYTYENIDAGNVGIKINLYGSDKGVDNVTNVTGRVWYNDWTTKIVEYITTEQSADYAPFVFTTKDAAEFHVDPTLNYSVDPTKVPAIYRKYKKPLAEIQTIFLRNMVRDAYRIVGNDFSSDSVMSNRGAFEAALQKSLSTTLLKSGFIFESLTSSLVPPQALRDMIVVKNTSIQATLKAENEAKQAEAEARVVKAKADGEATATLVRARAEAEANRLKQQTLTPLLIQQQWIEAWDGHLPTTSLGVNTPVIFNK